MMINVAMHGINIKKPMQKCPLSSSQQFHKLPKLKNDTSFLNYIGKGPNLQSLSQGRRISRFCLASTANIGINDEKSVIQLPEDLRPELMPKHIAVIMDGNGRWAMERGIPISEGHRAGVNSLKRMVFNCSKYGIKVLTVFGFSTENWSRSKVEVDFLLKACEDLIKTFIMEQVKRKKLRFSMIGDKLRFSQSLQDAVSLAEESSESNDGILHFVMAMSYSGRHDVTEAAKRIASKVEDGILRANDISQSVFEQELMTNLIEYPNPDLLIRTSGELRLSNFLLWQLAYSEFYFIDEMFPDFQEADFVEALRSFQGRQRRFGVRSKN